jgi:dipeptidyl aminopeptidase/acylaminoacyl peptidase
MDVSADPFDERYSGRESKIPFGYFVRLYAASLESVEQEIDSLNAQGLIDSGNVGVCGLSWGSAFAAYAITHSTRFGAAIIDHEVHDPLPALEIAPKSLRDAYERVGLGPRDRAHWEEFSTALRAGRIATPLLINADDREYLEVMQTYWAMRDHGRPVELWVFNDEYHAKWQPAHRLSIYNRNVDWFNYWLRNVRDSDESKRLQYERWDKFRILQQATIVKKHP